MDDRNGWNEWSRHVLAELRRLGEEMQATNKKLSSIQIDLIILKTKAGIIGAVAAILVSVLFDLYQRFR